jgi:hypothetical protein
MMPISDFQIRMAEKWYSRFTKMGKEFFLEMGLLSFSVVVYNRKNGQEVVDMYVSLNCFDFN